MTEVFHTAMAYLGGTIGAAIAVLGAALGIGKIAAAACEGTARQPEAAQQIRTTMIIAAALIEGLAFFALIMCLLGVIKTPETKPQSAQTAITQTTH